MKVLLMFVFMCILVDQIAMLEIVKAACSKVASNLCFELFHRFPNVKVMAALGMVYSQYLICEETIAGNFFPHFNLIKFALCVNKRLKRRFIVLRLLDSRQLDVQASHFRLTMNHNVEGMMHDSKDVNPIIHM
jgi:hypothetical protein